MWVRVCLIVVTLTKLCVEVSQIDIFVNSLQSVNIPKRVTIVPLRKDFNAQFVCVTGLNDSPGHNLRAFTINYN